MGPICEICDRQLGFDPNSKHECDPEVVKQRVRRLENAARTAERRLDDIQNAVMMILQTLPSLECEEVTFKSEQLRKLWDAAECQWHEAKTADSFLVCWMAKHRILCEAYDLFRKTKFGKTETLLTKLQELREAVDQSQKVLGYEDSKLDMTPEDLIRCQ